MRNGIYGHTSEETAYLIEDYPYGRLRCKRKVWLESDPKHGFRFVAQTQNPKNGRWNKPHKSTYREIAACLYLDDENHVQWAGVGAYTDEKEALQFALDFGNRCEGAQKLRVWAEMKRKACLQFVSGERYFTINGVKQERSEADNERNKQEAEVWGKVANVLTPFPPPL